MKLAVILCIAILGQTGALANMLYEKAFIECSRNLKNHKNISLKCIHRKMGLPDGPNSVSWDNLGISRNKSGQRVWYYLDKKTARTKCSKSLSTKRKKCIYNAMGIPSGSSEVKFGDNGLPFNRKKEIVKYYVDIKVAEKHCGKNIKYRDACIDNMIGTIGTPFITRAQLISRNMTIECKYIDRHARLSVKCAGIAFKREKPVKPKNYYLNKLRKNIKQKGLEEKIKNRKTKHDGDNPTLRQ